MTLGKSVLWQVGALFISVVVSGYFAVRLPARVPIHWDLSGQPDGWGSKWTLILLMPAFLLGFILLTVWLPKASPKGFKMESFEGTYGYLMALIAGLLATLHLIILQSAAGGPLDVTRALVGTIFLFFALCGNVMGRVRRNYWMGVRTPWTLSDERVWDRTHRSAGRIWLLGGAVGALAAFAGAPAAMMFAFLLVLCFAPVVQSYFIYRQLSD